jgi:putative hydrolase of the HAD superfamily
MRSDLILNIVFDFGGVVFKWDPVFIARTVFSDPLSIEKAQLIFFHNDWLEFDRGLINLEEVSKRSALNTGLPLEKISFMLQKIPVMMKPIVGTVDLIRRIKTKGHQIFALSNMPESSIQYFENNFNFLSLFNGLVISSRVHLLKPEIDIFMYLLNQFNLDPKDTIYIDDLPPNLQVASELGIHTIHFNSPSQCEEELKKYNGLII